MSEFGGKETRRENERSRRITGTRGDGFEARREILVKMRTLKKVSKRLVLYLK